MKFDKFLKNQYLGYAALALAAVNLLGYASVGSMGCIGVFVVAAYVANMYTKNRTVDILIALFVANVVFGCGRIKENFEGMETKAAKVANQCASLLKEEQCKKNSGCEWNSDDKKCMEKAKEAMEAANETVEKVKQAKNAKKEKKEKKH